MAGNLSPKLPWDLANPKWAATLNPVLANPLVNGQTLLSVAIHTGTNTISHGLGRKLQGYVVTLKSADISIYDTQPANQYPDLTLTLISSGAGIVNLYVF